MTIITLEHAHRLLYSAPAVSVLPYGRVYMPSLEMLTFTDNNAFMMLESCEYYDGTFRERDNQSVIIDGSHMTLTNDDGIKVEMMILAERNLEA